VSPTRSPFNAFTPIRANAGARRKSLNVAG